MSQIELNKNHLVDLITERINTIVIVIRPDGELTYISPSVERILGYKPSELLGEYWWKATRPDEFSAYEMIQTFTQLVKEKRIDELTTERLLYDANRNKKWILWNSAFDEEGNVVSVGYDITKRKHNEQKLNRSVKLLRNKQQEIIESLTYAQSIQHSILPSKAFLFRYFSEGELLYLPKDIVSGDFYWYYEANDHLYIACIDCTGHGVPGALMTILASNLLKSIVKHQQLINPAEILHELDHLLYDEFNRNQKTKRSDGMDIALLVIDKQLETMHFASAFHSLVYLVDNCWHELKGNRYPIGLYHDVQKSFDVHTICLKKDMLFVLFSDGIVDQFGGDYDKKFSKMRLKEILFKHKDVEPLLHEVQEQHKNWKSNKEQTDDILVMAFKI